MLFRIPITIQKRDEETEKWVDHMKVHSRINSNYKQRGYEKVSGGAIRVKRSLVFEVRYSKKLSELAYNTQLYRIIYDDVPFDIIDYDDFKEQHRFVKLTGAFY